MANHLSQSFLHPTQWELAAAPFTAPHADWMGVPSVDPTITSPRPAMPKRFARRFDGNTEARFLLPNLLQDRVNIDAFKGDEIHPSMFPKPVTRRLRFKGSELHSNDCGGKSQYKLNEDAKRMARGRRGYPVQIQTLGLKGALEAYDKLNRYVVKGTGPIGKTAGDADWATASDDNAIDFDSESEVDNGAIAAQAAAIHQVASLYSAVGEHMLKSQIPRTTDVDRDGYGRGHIPELYTAGNVLLPTSFATCPSPDGPLWASRPSRSSVTDSGSESSSFPSRGVRFDAALHLRQPYQPRAAGLSDVPDRGDLKRKMSDAACDIEPNEKKVRLSAGSEYLSSCLSSLQDTSSESENNSPVTRRNSPRNSLIIYRRRFRTPVSRTYSVLGADRRCSDPPPLPATCTTPATTSPAFSSAKASHYTRSGGSNVK